MRLTARSREFESHRFRQKGIVRTHAKVSSYFSFYMSVLACKYPLKTYYLNRLFLRRGKRKSVMNKAILPNKTKGTSENISECLTVCLIKYFVFAIMIGR